MVFIKQEESGKITSQYYNQLKNFQWLGPFGSTNRVMFYSLDKDERERKSVALILDFQNPSITLCLKESTSLKKLLLDPLNIILHVEPNYNTRSLDQYSLSEIICFAYLFVTKKENRFFTKKGMLNTIDPSIAEEI